MAKVPKTITLSETILERAEEYQKARTWNRSELIAYGLEKVFASESPDQKQEICLKRAVGRWVKIPFDVPIRSLWVLLHMLAKSYPDDSAKKFWTEPFYIGPRAATNKELLAEIRRDYEALISA